MLVHARVSYVPVPHSDLHGLQTLSAKVEHAADCHVPCSQGDDVHCDCVMPLFVQYKMAAVRFTNLKVKEDVIVVLTCPPFKVRLVPGPSKEV